MPQKTFTGTVIYWSWPILATSEQNTITSFTGPVWLGVGWESDPSSINLLSWAQMFWFSFSAFRVSVCISAPLTTQGWEGQTEEKPSLYSGHMNYKLSHATHILKYWPSFLNTLNWFPSPFMHHLLPIPCVAQGSGEADPAAGGRKVCELWPSLNMGLSLVWLQRINLINAYHTKEWLLFPKKTAPKINLYLEELKSFQKYEQKNIQTMTGAEEEHHGRVGAPQNSCVINVSSVMAFSCVIWSRFFAI